MPFGYNGKILRVNLSNERITIENPDESFYRRFLSTQKDMAHELLQDFVIIDYTKDMAILAILMQDEKEEVVGIGQYFLDKAATHNAKICIAVADDYQNRGIGKKLISYLIYLAKKQGLLGFHSEVLKDNEPMLHIFKKFNFNIEMLNSEKLCKVELMFKF